ncbi:MAG: hypothetical protein J6B63_02885 [Treponema sp.]|nr:hypothetical protein [Treponema sp.]MBP3607572.1 hypothetical protein [Treponema sp.]
MIYKVEEVSAGLCTGTLRTGAIEAKIKEMEKRGWKFEQTETIIGRFCLFFQRYKAVICFSKEAESLSEDSTSIQVEENTTSKITENLGEYLYLLGMLITTIGFCCPMFKSSLGSFLSSLNGFRLMPSIGALLIFIGAVVGLAYSVLPMLEIKLPSSTLVKKVAVIASIIGGIILILKIGFHPIGIRATYGFYVVVIGWIVSLVGIFSKSKK